LCMGIRGLGKWNDPQSPITNPQSPIPNPHKQIKIFSFFELIYFKK